MRAQMSYKVLEPVEEIGILRGRESACEGLIKVMVRIDETGQDDMNFEINHIISRLGKRARRADLINESVSNEKTPPGNFPLMVVHGHKVGILDKKSRLGCSE